MPDIHPSLSQRLDSYLNICPQSYNPPPILSGPNAEDQLILGIANIIRQSGEQITVNALCAKLSRASVERTLPHIIIILPQNPTLVGRQLMYLASSALRDSRVPPQQST